MSIIFKMTHIAFGTCDTPVGELLICCSENGLLAVSYAGRGGSAAGRAASDLRKRVKSRIPEARIHEKTASAAISVVAEVADELAEYFAGDRTAWNIPLDWRLTSGFRRDAQEAAFEIGYGKTLSYGELAAAAGNPRAARAAGTAMATNPISIVVPCHRVLRSGGDVGNYGGGSDAKKFLLALEQKGLERLQHPMAEAA